MEFKEMLKYAKAYDKRAMMDIIEMYRPLLISKSVVNGKFDVDVYFKIPISSIKTGRIGNKNTICCVLILTQTIYCCMISLIQVFFRK